MNCGSCSRSLYCFLVHHSPGKENKTMSHFQCRYTLCSLYWIRKCRSSSLYRSPTAELNRWRCSCSCVGTCNRRKFWCPHHLIWDTKSTSCWRRQSKCSWRTHTWGYWRRCTRKCTTTKMSGSSTGGRHQLRCKNKNFGRCSRSLFVLLAHPTGEIRNRSHYLDRYKRKLQGRTCSVQLEHSRKCSSNCWFGSSTGARCLEKCSCKSCGTSCRRRC